MKKYLFFAICVGLLTVSCAKEFDNNKLAPKDKLVFTCVIADDDLDSKVSLVNDGSVGKTSWEVGDEIMIHGGTDGATFQKVTLKAADITEEGKKATITMDYMEPYDRADADVVSKYYAQYPASAVPTGSNMYYECRFNDTKKLLMAACDVDNTFVFFHLSAAIAYTVSDSSAPEPFATAVFSGNNNEAVAYDVYQARVRQDKGKDARCYYWKPGNGSGDPVASAVYSSVPATDGTTVNYIYLPSGSGANGQYNVSYSGVNFTRGFTIKFLNAGGDEVQRVSTSTAKNIHAGELLDLGDITSKLYTYTPVFHESTIGCPDDDSVYDLSKDGSANCYIINAADATKANKVFKFKAYCGKSTTGVGKIDSVVLLWETWNTSSVTANSVIASVDYDKQAANDYYEICFKTPETLHAGNAVIAAKNSEGHILWSWHIWVPSSAVTSNDYGLDGDQVWMDRNLGALTVAEASGSDDVSPSSFGLFYSWGRKDPFPGLLALDNKTMIATTGSFDFSGAQMSVSASYALPTTFVSTGSDSVRPWTTDDSSALWGSSKTIYDPCPPGYVVPAFKNGKGLWKGASGTGFAIDATHKWFKMGESPNFIVFPLVGYIDGAYDPAKIVNYGSRATIWSSTTTSDAGLSYNLRVNSDGTSSCEYQREQRASSIRCIAE